MEMLHGTGAGMLPCLVMCLVMMVPMVLPALVGMVVRRRRVLPGRDMGAMGLPRPRHEEDAGTTRCGL